MKGTSDSEVAIEAEINARNTRADTERCFLILISIFFFQFTDGHSLSHGSFLSSIYMEWTKTYGQVITYKLKHMNIYIAKNEMYILMFLYRQTNLYQLY